MLTAVLIDDEPDALKVLSKLLLEYTTIPIKIVGTAEYLEKGVEIIKQTKPDVVFLDIEMPGRNGMDIYKFFEKPAFKVIFVTAYSQFAIDALKNSASDYLLKPVNFIELREALKKVTEEFLFQQHQREIEDKLALLSTSDMEGKNILFEVESGFVMENTKNIEYCYANQSYSVIVNFLGKEILVSKPLKELQTLLPCEQFYRTHKSYLVNIFYIRKFVRASESYVLLRSGKKIPVSVRTSSVIARDIKQMLSL